MQSAGPKPNRSGLQWLGRVCACFVQPCAAARCCSRSAPRLPQRRTVHFDGQRGRRARRLAGLPPRRAPAHVRAARPPARSTWARPGASQRCPARGDRAPAGDPGRPGAPAPGASAGQRRSRRHAPVVGARKPSPASASTPARHPRRGRWPPGRPRPTAAIGVYIGGANRACSQPNLTADWVGEQVAAGWHLIPTYVGLQAPTSACSSCAKLSSSLTTATVQGAEAARDAVADAAEHRHGPGSPIYFDMEAYTRTSSATSATLTFLCRLDRPAARARLRLRRLQLQRLGNRRPRPRESAAPTRCPTTSGPPTGTAGQNTLDPYLPATAWAAHQRIHQYRGGHNETYGLTTINIDNNFVDGATVGAAIAAPELPPLTVKHVKPEGGTVRVWVRCGWPEGESCPGQIILRTHARLPLRARPGVPTQSRAPRRQPPHLPPRRRQVAHLPRRPQRARGAAAARARLRSRPSCWSRSPTPAPRARFSSGGLASGAEPLLAGGAGDRIRPARRSAPAPSAASRSRKGAGGRTRCRAGRPGRPRGRPPGRPGAGPCRCRPRRPAAVIVLPSSTKRPPTGSAP